MIDAMSGCGGTFETSGDVCYLVAVRGKANIDIRYNAEGSIGRCA